MELLFGLLEDLIAFTKMHKGRFYIGVMKSVLAERLLTENYYQEAPSGHLTEEFGIL